MSLAICTSAARSPGRERPTDIIFLRQALAMGGRHLGLTSPNPSVGAVLVDETPGRVEVLARAVTAPNGRPHAEKLVIDAAGERALGATLFVTLEPCAHHGRTPPCAEAVIAAGVARVVCGIEDPDRRVAGKGFDLLTRAGIEVVTGILEPQSRELHAGHILRVTVGRPFVTLKLAMTADGFGANGDGHPLAITGKVANSQAHLLRSRSDAILVGVGTVLADDPQLTCRLPGLDRRSPIRVVLDTQLRTPPTATLVISARATPSWIITGPDAAQRSEARLTEAGVTVIRVPAGKSGHADIQSAMQALGERGVTRLMCEGGPALADELAKEGLLDEFVLIRSARKLDSAGLPAIGPSLTGWLAQRQVVPTEELKFGDDRWTRYVRSQACSREL